MDIQQLRYFLAAAEKGSLTKAAETLYTTQPHVSQVIKSLERDLGAPLFSRGPSGITLTEEGERVRFYAESVFKNIAMIRDICGGAGEQRLRIAANPSSSLAFLMEDFFESYLFDGFTLEYTECGIERMMDLLKNRQYDLGLLFIPGNKLSALSRLTERRGLRYTPRRSTDLVVHAGVKSRWYGKPLLRPDELDGCACVQLEDDFFSVEELLEESAAFRSGKCALKKVVRTNSDHLMIRTLEQTDLCNISSYWLRGMYKKHNFSMSVIDGFQGRVSFGYLSMEHKAPRFEVSVFLERLKSAIAAETSLSPADSEQNPRRSIKQRSSSHLPKN